MPGSGCPPAPALLELAPPAPEALELLPAPPASEALELESADRGRSLVRAGQSRLRERFRDRWPSLFER